MRALCAGEAFLTFSKDPVVVERHAAEQSRFDPSRWAPFRAESGHTESSAQRDSAADPASKSGGGGEDGSRPGRGTMTLAPGRSVGPARLSGPLDSVLSAPSEVRPPPVAASATAAARGRRRSVLSVNREFAASHAPGDVRNRARALLVCTPDAHARCSLQRRRVAPRVAQRRFR
jgi:hypothetical protein